ncbi:MAG TPA: hypothetical protein VJ110_01600 [Candidatus Nanoarchaeia archaeon]|nr:hypothetical protein [Candidatus Nanoarchaeia archaeon]
MSMTKEDWQKMLDSGEKDKQAMLRNVELAEFFQEAIRNKIKSMPEK